MDNAHTPESLFVLEPMTSKLRVPCAYQGGKQRVASQIVDELLYSASSSDSTYYDLCCGSGAISIELVNRGIDPSRIVMLDLSSWGTFWAAIGENSFDMQLFDQILSQIPTDKRLVKSFMQSLSKDSSGIPEAELYPILQSASFGGKQIWRENNKWVNAFFRDYWEPTATSVRRSPANPMQPSPIELRRRIHAISKGMKGLTCVREDIRTTLDWEIKEGSVIYIDPPYSNTTGYAFKFDVASFASQLSKNRNVKLFISEGRRISENAQRLTFGGAKGGISGNRIGKHEEWLSRFF